MEFVDRYGGNCPPVLRGCSTCDAMGCSPDMDGFYAGKYGKSVDSVPFLTCDECHGRAVVPWQVTLKRFFPWLWKGLKWVLLDPAPGTRRERFNAYFVCEFRDMLRYKPRTSSGDDEADYL